MTYALPGARPGVGRGRLGAQKPARTAAARTKIRKHWRILALCLFGPVVASIARKVMPGQPLALEIAGFVAAPVGLLVAPVLGRRLPSYLRQPLVLWIVFQVVFVILAVPHDWRIGATATATRILPMGMTWVAYACIRELDDVTRVAHWFAVLALILVPSGIYTAIFGHESLPALLQPVQRFEDLHGSSWRGQFPTPSGVFANNGGLAHAMLASTFMLLAGLAASRTKLTSHRRAFLWLAVAGALLLIFLAARRTIVIWTAVGVATYLLSSRQRSFGMLVAVGLLLVGVYELGDLGLAERARIGDRTEILGEMDFQWQLSNAILFELDYWFDATPLGTFLGSVGPERAAFGLPRSLQLARTYVELGCGQMLAETGVAGLLLMPIIIGYMLAQLMTRATGMRCAVVVRMLSVFVVVLLLQYYFKGQSALTRVTIAQMLFWAALGIAAAVIDAEERERRGPTLVRGSGGPARAGVPPAGRAPMARAGRSR